MFKWLSKLFGSNPIPSPVPPRPAAPQERIIVTTDNIQSIGRANRETKRQEGRRTSAAQRQSRSSLADDTNARRRDSYMDDTLTNPLNPLSPLYVGNNYADSTPSESYSSRSETCSPSNDYSSSSHSSSSSSYDSGSSSSSYDSGSSSSSDSGGSCGGGGD